VQVAGIESAQDAHLSIASKLRVLLEKATARFGRGIVWGVPTLFLLAFFAAPFLVVLRISFSEMEGVRFKDVIGLTDGEFFVKLRYATYVFLTEDPLYIKTYLSSIEFAAITTAICLAIGYPMAYFMACSPASIRPALVMLVMLPFWTSFLLRVYAWKMLLADSGVFNNIGLALGVIDSPIKMMHTPFSLVLGMVYTYLPFMVLPLYANLVKMDLRLLEAARDLGASPWTAFWRVTVPLSKNGIIAGALLVFIPCVGEFVIPELLGGPQTLMIGRVLWDEFFSNNDWPMAASVAVVMVLMIVVPLAYFNKLQNDAATAGRS
jgi:putrescine transport system permease protein